MINLIPGSWPAAAAGLALVASIVLLWMGTRPLVPRRRNCRRKGVLPAPAKDCQRNGPEAVP